MRWWDGTQWTDHLHQAAPVAPPQAQPQFQATPQFQAQFHSVQPHPPQAQPAQSPVLQAPVFQTPAIQPTPPAAQQAMGYQSLATGGSRNHSLVPGFSRDDPHDYGPNRNSAQSAVAYSAMPTSNAVAWISLAAGAVSLATILIVRSLPAGTYIFPFFGLTAIVTGIR